MDRSLGMGSRLVASRWGARHSPATSRQEIHPNPEMDPSPVMHRNPGLHHKLQSSRRLTHHNLPVSQE